MKLSLMKLLKVLYSIPKGGGESYLKRTGELVAPLGVEKAVLAPFSVFSLERSSVEAFVVPCRVLSPKNYERRYCFRIGFS